MSRKETIQGKTNVERRIILLKNRNIKYKNSKQRCYFTRDEHSLKTLTPDEKKTKTRGEFHLLDHFLHVLRERVDRRTELFQLILLVILHRV